MHAKKCRTQAHIDLCDLYPRNFVLNVESAIDYLDALKVSECTVKLTSACVRTHVLSRQRSISEQPAASLLLWKHVGQVGPNGPEPFVRDPQEKWGNS